MGFWCNFWCATGCFAGGTAGCFLICGLTLTLGSGIAAAACNIGGGTVLGVVVQDALGNA